MRILSRPKKKPSQELECNYSCKGVACGSITCDGIVFKCTAVGGLEISQDSIDLVKNDSRKK